MAKELDNKKMWELLIEGNSVTYESGRVERGDLALRIIRALRDQGFDYQDGDIVPIEPEFKANSGQNKNQIGGQKGGQKPKFKVGDWIIDIQGVSSNQIIGYEDDSYYIKTSCSEFYLPMKLAEKNYRLWTIQDAKDGDVLSYVTDEEDLWIMIYWSLYEPYEGHVHYHALLVNNNFSDKGTCYICIDNLKPATKEQRDLLFAKMKEAGYEWDAEHKQLKKIEQKPEYPLAHEKMETERWKEACKAACSDINYRSHYGLTETRDDYFVDGVHWADEHPKQKQWKPTKEQLLAIDTAINVVGKNTLSGDALIGLLEQLKAL